jgi:ribosomal-protein-serine acetyltransferase
LLGDWAFTAGGFVRLELLIEVENEKSRAVAERAGHRCDGELAKKFWKDGAHRDIALYSRIA